MGRNERLGKECLSEAYGRWPDGRLCVVAQAVANMTATVATLYGRSIRIMPTVSLKITRAIRKAKGTTGTIWDDDELSKSDCRYCALPGVSFTSGSTACSHGTLFSLSNRSFRSSAS